MSRSYKKSPVCTHRKHGAKWWKRQANRKVRYNSDSLRGKGYQKMYCWNIHDFISRESKADAIVWYNKVTKNSSHSHYRDWVLEKWPTIDEYLSNCWEHDYHRK